MNTFSVYYGPPTPEALTALGQYALVILQVGLYAPRKLAALRAGGTRVLGYLSVGEDHDQGDWACVPGSAPYHRAANPLWRSVTVDPAHPEWQATLLRRAEVILNNADGLLLDTIDGYPAASPDAQALACCVHKLRTSFPQATLLSNRGFNLLPQLAQDIDGVLFTSFTTTYTPTYAVHSASDLAFTLHWFKELRALSLLVYALDYADSPQLAEVAYRRAEQLGLGVFVTNQHLTCAGGLR